MRKILVGLLVVITLSHGGAYASHQDVPDPNDTEGALDIKKVASFGLRSPARRIVTYKEWSTSSMWDSGYFIVWYDTAANRHFDFFILVRSAGNWMDATLWRNYRRRPDRVVGDAQVWRPSAREVVTRIRLSQLWFSKGRDRYRWKVQSVKTTGPNCRNVCFDRAPNTGVVVEPKPPPKGGG